MSTPASRQREREAAALRAKHGVALWKTGGYSLSAASTLSAAPKETIRRRANGQLAQSERTGYGPQRLNVSEEEALVGYILQMEASGFPMRQLDVEASAQALVRAKQKDDTAPEPLGPHWFSRFIERHESRLAFRTKASLSRERARGLTRSNATHFYNLLYSLQEQYKFDAQAILSMDETGVQHGVASRSFKYAVSSQRRDQTAAARKDGSQELTTVIETIAADGTALPPVYIFKGKKVDLSLAFEETLGGYITSSETGWTNSAIAQKWFERVLLPTRGGSSQPAPRLLIMDGHGSHFTLQMLEMAVAANIHILALPAHTTHGMAPLDRTCFGPLKQAWAEAQRHEMMMTGVVRKEDVIRLYQEARQKAFTVANIRKGYAATGIWPFKRDAIPESMFYEPLRTDAEMQETREDSVMSNDLADALSDLEGQQRSLKAKSILISAVRNVREATATAVLFKDLTERLRHHAAAMKCKPRPHRVAQDGRAKLYTAAEAMETMRAAQQAREDEWKRKEAEAEARELRKEAREKEEAEKKLRQEAIKQAREAKRVADEAAKQQRKVVRESKKRAREAEAAEK
ncbi:hypothetical protein CF326_g8796, partial [Tilletia indica]